MASTSSADDNAVIIDVTMDPGSPPAPSSPPPAAVNTAEITAHPLSNGDVAMDDAAENSDGSARPNDSHGPDYINNEDVEMSPREDESPHPIEKSETKNDLESSSAPPPEHSVSSTSKHVQSTNPTDEISMDDSMEEEYSATDGMNTSNDMAMDSSALSAELLRLDDNLDGALDQLQRSISVAILAFRKEDQKDENMSGEAGNSSNDGSDYQALREAAMTAHQTLVEYGSSLDLSLADSSDKGDTPLTTRRAEKLKKVGRDLWKIIRANPDLFNDVITDVTKNNVDISSSCMEQKRQCVVAGGYIRIIAVRLIFLHYIDTRCSMACPPALHRRQDGNKSHIPSPKELVFGLKLLSKGGRAILRHEKNARDAHDSLSLAISCFNVLSSMAESNGEAANEMKDALLDEAFDICSALPDAAALFEGGQCADVSEKEDDASTQANNSTVDWPFIVQKHLDSAKTFIMNYCSDALIDENKSTLKYIALQRFLPTLSKLCLKHGSRYMKFGMNEQAKDALNTGLTVTNSCLKYVKEERERTKRKSETQMLENLEAQVLQISIESFYTLSSVVHSLGRKDEALRCLDQVEAYMEEKHRRDDQLHEGAMADLCKDGEFVFSEYAIGPAQDRADMRSRADTAVTKGRHIHSWQKAVLSTYRIKLYNDNPSEEDERCIDRELRSIVELVSEREDITLVGESMKENNILKLALKNLRSVHTRRMMLYLSNVEERGDNSAPDTYRIMIDQLSTSHQLRPSVVLDKIIAILHVSSEVRRRKLESVFHSVDQEAIILADQFLSSLKHETPSDTTLFVDTKNVMKTELINDAKEQFIRAASLYHSWDAHEICAKWARMLKDLLKMSKDTPEHGDEHLLATVLSLLAFSLSMSGNYAEGMKMAREAWDIHKCVNNLVTMFQCATKHEPADTLLEFDNALNELPVIDHDSILEHFPRLSNICVENEADGGGELLLGVQERWMNLFLRSKKLAECLEKREECECDLTVLDLLSAYLENFEHVSSTQTDSQKFQNLCEYLGHIIDGVLRLLQLCRDRKPAHRRKKTKISKESSEGDTEFDSMWDDAATQKLLGTRDQCVCVAEMLWNIGNQLMITSVLDNASYDSRALAADLFAASHDFILMSEEEEGAQLSKLDYDVKYEPEKFEVPSFNGDSTSAASDISSEFSAQCLLLSAAVTVDHVDMSKVEHSSTKSLLRRTVHRLATSQQEYELNCKKRGKISKTIALLTMRCIIGIGEDSFAFQTCNDGLCDTLLELHCKNVARTEERFQILAQMKAISDLAMQKQLTHTDRVITKLCSDMMQKSNVFEANLGGGVVLSLGDLKRKMVQQSVSVEEAIEVFQGIDDIVKKKEGLGGGDKMMFSAETFSWFAIEAHTRGVQLSMIGDDDKAKIFFSFALNFVEFSTKEVRSYKQEMMSSFTRAVQTLDFPKLN